jgi:hypothetical protein
MKNLLLALLGVVIGGAIAYSAHDEIHGIVGPQPKFVVMNSTADAQTASNQYRKKVNLCPDANGFATVKASEHGFTDYTLAQIKDLLAATTDLTKSFPSETIRYYRVINSWEDTTKNQGALLIVPVDDKGKEILKRDNYNRFSIRKLDDPSDCPLDCHAEYSEIMYPTGNAPCSAIDRTAKR